MTTPAEPGTEDQPAAPRFAVAARAIARSEAPYPTETPAQAARYAAKIEAYVVAHWPALVPGLEAGYAGFLARQ